MKTIKIENSNILVCNAAGAIEFSSDVHEFVSTVYVNADMPDAGDHVELNAKFILKYDEAQDADGNTVADVNELLTYTKTLQNTVVELGEAIQLGNVIMRSTGEEILQINNNTNRKTLNVFQEVTTAGTERVFFRNQETGGYVDEDSSNAYNPISANTQAATLNAAGRYVLPLDIQVSGSKFVQGYRSKSQTGLVNGNIKVFNIKQAPEDVSKYNTLTGTGISAGWYISKRPHWKYRTEAEITNTAGFNLGTGDIELPINEGFELTDGEVYRFVISADNEFTMDGYSTAPMVTAEEGGTQFVPYLERTYFGQVDTLVVTYGARNVQGQVIDFSRDHTDTTILLSLGDNHAVNSITAYEDNGTISITTNGNTTPIYTNITHSLVTIGGNNAGSTVSGVVDALNALFQVTPLGLGGDYVSTLPTLAGVDITANFAEGQTPITGDLYSVASDTSQHGARVWSDETIDESGEFYEVKITGKGQFMLGLYSVDDGDLTEITNNSGNGHSGYKWANAFYNYGSYIAPWTTYGSNSGLSYGAGWTGSGNEQMMRYKSIIQDALVNGDPVLFKVGIGANGHVEVYYFDEGVTNSYIMTARSSYTLNTGNYGLLIKLVNGTVRLVETPKRVAVDPVAPTLTYYYIESPDGAFHYPLFATAEEADYYDSQNGGGGSSHQHIYIDDAVPGTIWYMPDNGSTMNATAAPSNSATVTYNVISTLDDALFAPPAFANQTITVDELTNVNLQIHPQDANFTTSIGGIPAWSYVNGYLVGQAPEVTGTNDVNPQDTTTVTVYRTNVYGTSQGTITININNLTAPIITAITGFTHDATSTALVDADTMGDGSVVEIDETLGDVQRLVILQSFVETYVLPSLTTAGDKYIVGNLNAAADVSTLEESDYDFAIVWEYVSATAHKYKFVRDGSVLHQQTVNSNTDAFYDYAIELNDSVWLIACNVNSINSEPSPAHGGSFTNNTEITSFDNTAPLNITISNIGTNSDFGTTGLSEIVVPRPANWIQVEHDASHDLLFEGLEDMPTLQAGYTYRFLMGDNEYDDQTTNTQLASGDVLRFTADGTTEYTTGITRSGTVGANGSYVEFVVPSDVPPLWWYDGAAGISQNDSVSISGSTYVVTVTGITLEGPVANQTGTNIIDQYKYGWMSLNEPLSAGERLVLDNGFWTDILGYLNNTINSTTKIFGIGLKGDSWANTKQINNPTAAQSDNTFKGNTYITVQIGSSNEVRLRAYANGFATNEMLVNTVSLHQTVCAFLEVTSSGNNIR